MTNLFAQLPTMTRKPKRGFTLTEIAIVLGIIGIILGAIWAAAATVYENMRAERAAGDVLTIVGGWRSIYGAKQVDVADWTDITAATINAKIMPPDMIQTGNTSYGVGPWSGSYVYVYGIQTQNAVDVLVWDISQSACNRLAQAILGSSSAPIQAGLNNDWRTFPPLGTSPYYTTTDIANDCANSNTNAIFVTYAM